MFRQEHFYIADCGLRIADLRFAIVGIRKQRHGAFASQSAMAIRIPNPQSAIRNPQSAIGKSAIGKSAIGKSAIDCPLPAI